MTIAIGLRTIDGILLSADAEYTAGTVKYTGQKVFGYEIADGFVAGFAITGSVPHAKAAIKKMVASLKKPTSMDYATAEACAEHALENYYKHSVFTHPLYNNEAGPYFGLIVAFAHSGSRAPRLYETYEETLNQVPHYSTIGAGSDLAKFLIEPMARRALTVNNSLALMNYVLEATKENRLGCGKHSDFVFLRNEGLISEVSKTEIQAMAEYQKHFYQDLLTTLFLSADLSLHDDMVIAEFNSFANKLLQTRVQQQERREALENLLKQLTRIHNPDSNDGAMNAPFSSNEQ